uniref:Pre-mRNA-splicing regulator WTAP n=1 Tax=Oncorhynchus tshawytscha TaxID=74940 RepID=A0AAZ3QGT3_ONCTS
MAKCRMLIQENQELGRQISQGRIAQLEAELALQKKYSEELKSSQDELNDFIIQLDEEVEGMQSTILVLQQQLRETRQQLTLRESSVPGSAPLDQHPESEAGKDCVAGLVKANGPGNTGPFDRTETAPGPSPFTEAETGINTEQDQESLPSPSPSTTGTDSKLCSHFRTITNQLSEGYETVDSPTGSDTSVTQHFIETNSNQDPQEDRIVARTSSSKGGRTVGSCSTQNGLNVTGGSNVNSGHL